MTIIQILYWHTIPIQVRAIAGRNRQTVALPPRFMEAVDAAAMSAGLTGSDAYSDLFRWGEAVEKEGEPAELAQETATELEAAWQSIDWKRVAVQLKTAK
ncbi:MAG TPA: virulence factor [Anaerolineales bacterium]|nr:virulence factor [Anaerolineales bacterium]